MYQNQPIPASEIKRELTPYELWQLERYGDVIPELSILPDGTCENNEEEIERGAAWVNQQAEFDMMQHENH